MCLSSNQLEQLDFFFKNYLLKVINDELVSPYLIDDILANKDSTVTLKERKSAALCYLIAQINKKIKV